jgi:hypothetical protein
MEGQAMCSVRIVKFKEYPSHGSRDTDEKALPSPSNLPFIIDGTQRNTTKLVPFFLAFA